MSLTLSEAVLCLKDAGDEDIPKDHRLDVTTVTRQTLGVFSHTLRKTFIIFFFAYIEFCKLSDFKVILKNLSNHI